MPLYRCSSCGKQFKESEDRKFELLRNAIPVLECNLCKKKKEFRTELAKKEAQLLLHQEKNKADKELAQITAAKEFKMLFPEEKSEISAQYEQKKDKLLLREKEKTHQAEAYLLEEQFRNEKERQEIEDEQKVKEEESTANQEHQTESRLKESMKLQKIQDILTQALDVKDKQKKGSFLEKNMAFVFEDK